MKKTAVVLSISFFSLSLTGCLVKPDLTESSSYLEIAGNKYRKTGAINTDILFAGVKRGRGFNDDTFDPKFMPVLEQDITARQVTEAFNEQTGKAAFEAASKAGVEKRIEGGASGVSKVTGRYSVFTLFDVNRFVSELNSDKNRNNIKMLTRYDEPRIITSVAIVFGRDASSNANASGNASLKIKNTGNPVLSFNGGGSDQTLSKLSNGTVFAYEYSRICWEKHDGKIRVATIEVDRPSLDLDANCPSGTKDHISKL